MNKIALVYFSPTGNTKKTLVEMARAIGCRTETVDLTENGKEFNEQFESDDLVIMGAPVYGGRIPKVAAERFAGIKGNKTPCIVVVSYGNRDYDDALLEMKDMAEGAGFIVKGAAAVVGRHTYGDIQILRPDMKDLKASGEFAVKAAAKLDEDPAPEVPGNRPYKEGGNAGKFHPLTDDSCIDCGLCRRVCPVGAIAEDNRTIDPEKCLSCFRCIRECPVGSKNMNTPEYNEFAKMFTEKLKVRKENQYFL